MTNLSKSQEENLNNSYGKPAAALSVLRETIMGPELFDMLLKNTQEGVLNTQTRLGLWKTPVL